MMASAHSNALYLHPVQVTVEEGERNVELEHDVDDGVYSCFHIDVPLLQKNTHAFLNSVSKRA